ncbi:fimbrial protein [Intestinirhabdus alba]|jgi:type 1 fimbria pilin|uniref:Fimbrial protein n=1 Tax=Intestinirhabdus alba TaxID=2899544 RepID=A0A6L6IGB9_9ENTR|nr:fimbrial protein [Intestinirhabdus alba]MTH44964.1 fimbrial protein [Intestinirhabdus alba]
MRRYCGVLAIATGWVLFCLRPALATNLTTEMAFKGTLIDPPPCAINGGQPVAVDFGRRVGVNRVDGRRYIQPVEYHLICYPDSPRSGLNIVMTTTAPAAFDASAVQSSVDGLAIRVLVEGEPITFGKPIAVSVDHPPVMQAVPVKAAGVALEEGLFSATATLQVIYQ